MEPRRATREEQWVLARYEPRRQDELRQRLRAMEDALIALQAAVELIAMHLARLVELVEVG